MPSHVEAVSPPSAGYPQPFTYPPPRVGQPAPSPPPVSAQSLSAHQWPPPPTAPPLSPRPVEAGASFDRSDRGSMVGGGRRRLAWPGILALLFVLALGGLAGFQAYQIDRLSDRLDAAERSLADAQSGDGARFESLEGRTGELEKQAGNVFNPEAISSVVLPSVFRVAAGDITGTAFAVGKPAGGAGTNLFTNFHVVEAVWNGGGRQVFIQRRDQRFPATIVKVDKKNDVALLKATGSFAGLVTTTGAVKSGQQIVVVGAPLGLEDTVTTGVVSAFRKTEDGSANFIQFDAPINPGNSGGPVVNSAKQVVGIATAKARDAEGIGLAVPIEIACDQFKVC